ncbi:uncharacterized protein LOC117325627 [Pecten maximus]|uniref:uncharacterized protein LOC117325627 n=1 Tax=Pecten maximus TaxID=6579 RepID=UPI001458E2F4|nr:uncharacterized protein LOC117325627 [Pecten maximus]
MIKDRQKEYNNMLAKKESQSQPKQRSIVDGEDKSLPLSYNQHKQLPQARKPENIDTKKASDKSGRNPLEGEAISLPISGHEKERRRLMEERRREYNEMIGQHKSKKPNQKGTKSTWVPEERESHDPSNNDIRSDLKHQDFTQVLRLVIMVSNINSSCHYGLKYQFLLSLWSQISIPLVITVSSYINSAV